MYDHLMKIEDGRSYPALTGKLFVFDPGAAVPGEMGYSKLWMCLNANGKLWNEETRRPLRNGFGPIRNLSGPREGLCPVPMDSFPWTCNLKSSNGKSGK